MGRERGEGRRAKKTELHKKQREGQKEVFRRSTEKVEGLESNPSETHQNTKKADMPWAGRRRETRGLQAGASKGLQEPPGASKGRAGFLKGRAGKLFEAILDPHKTRNTPSCGMERTTGTQNSEGGGFRKSPQRNLPEQ